MNRVSMSSAGFAWSRWLRIAILVMVPLSVGAAVALLLREPFGPMRLAAKSVVPFAVLLPVMSLMGRARARSATSLAATLVTMTVVTWACFAVYGVPVDPRLILSLLSLAEPSFGPIGLALGIGLPVIALRYRFGHQSLTWAGPGPALLAVILAAGEATYFGGFLLGSTASLGTWSWALVGAGVLLSAALRGVPTTRALIGSAAFVAMMTWSGSPYAAFLIHVAFLDAASENTRPVRSVTTEPRNSSRPLLAAELSTRHG